MKKQIIKVLSVLIALRYLLQAKEFYAESQDQAIMQAKLFSCNKSLRFLGL